ncbi:MAG: hypothetical protein WC494_00775 [Candidatus Pacearchaeota archaeon]
MEKDDFDLKEEYEKTRKKYNLPAYEDLASNFDIEKIGEKESSYVLRDIRRIIVEKISAYMHFFEGLINPSSSSLFVLSMIKKVNKEIQEKVNKDYKVFSKFQIKSMKLDTIYDESSEADFIKEFYDKWQEMKKGIYELIENLGEDIDNGKEERKGGYFG